MVPKWRKKCQLALNKEKHRGINRISLYFYVVNVNTLSFPDGMVNIVEHNSMAIQSKTVY